MPKFKPGQSGNPGGRPKTRPELRARCRSFGEQIVDRLIEIVLDKEAQHRDVINAGDKLLMYGFGRPVNANEMNLLINNSAKNDDGGEVQILVGFGKDGRGVTLDQFAEQVKPKPAPPNTRQIEDLRPAKVSEALARNEAAIRDKVAEIERLRAVLEGRAADWDESNWSHNLPSSSGSDWPGSSR
jgi:hypothetical protein